MAGKYKPYPAYKPSGVEWMGDIPEGWRIQPCRANVDHHMDKNSDGKSENYLSLMANIGIIPYAEKGDVGNKKPDDLSKCKIVRVGDLVINSMNYAIGSYGMSPYDGICSPVYIVLSAKPSKLLSRFALRVFENKPFQKHLAVFGNGILEHRAAIGWDTIKGQYISVPPLEEQEAILGFLDHETAKIDALIAKQQRLIALLEEKRQAVINHAVTKGLDRTAPLRPSGIEWLGDVPAHWAVKKLLYLLSAHPKNGLSPEIAAGGSVSTFSTAAVQNGEVDIANHLKGTLVSVNIGKPYFVAQNDVLVLRGSGSKEIVGKVGIVLQVPPASCIYPDILIRIRPNDLNWPYYLVECLNCSSLRPQIEVAAQTAAGIWKISGSSLQALRLPVPPLEEQHEIGEFIRNQNSFFYGLVSNSQSAITLLKERRTTLISAAVTGKIDLRDWKPPEGNYDIFTKDRDQPEEAFA